MTLVGSPAAPSVADDRDEIDVTIATASKLIAHDVFAWPGANGLPIKTTPSWVGCKSNGA